MGFLILFLCGIAGGMLGGMGMGGGTALIPLLTLLGVGQSAAQGVNLVSFLPMACIALFVHTKAGLVKGRGILPLVLPALGCSALCSLAAAQLPDRLLEPAFGVFLLILAFFRLRAAILWKKIPPAPKQ